ncbi:hypothetical protein ABDJ38_16790 [Aurantiacibacter sp. DGU5]|uniref:DUF2968 domain-containing protein n=1 Tax=Aurantiacibacter flavus TaxID=3145232 RepID=A0ABV0D121_9SPHN
MKAIAISTCRVLFAPIIAFMVLVVGVSSIPALAQSRYEIRALASCEGVDVAITSQGRTFDCRALAELLYINNVKVRGQEFEALYFSDDEGEIYVASLGPSIQFAMERIDPRQLQVFRELAPARQDTGSLIGRGREHRRWVDVYRARWLRLVPRTFGRGFEKPIEFLADSNLKPLAQLHRELNQLRARRDELRTARQSQSSRITSVARGGTPITPAPASSLLSPSGGLPTNFSQLRGPERLSVVQEIFRGAQSWSAAQRRSRCDEVFGFNRPNFYRVFFDRDASVEAVCEASGSPDFFYWRALVRGPSYNLASDPLLKLTLMNRMIRDLRTALEAGYQHALMPLAQLNDESSAVLAAAERRRRELEAERRELENARPRPSRLAQLCNSLNATRARMRSMGKQPPTLPDLERDGCEAAGVPIR